MTHIGMSASRLAGDGVGSDLNSIITGTIFNFSVAKKRTPPL